MTHPGAPQTTPPPEGAAASLAQQQGPYAATPSAAPGQGYAPPGWAPQPPAQPGRDSTRTIAIIALVVGSVALLGQMLTMVVPFLFFGVFGLLGSGFETGEGVFGESASVTIGGGQVATAPGGTVPAAALTSAVRDVLGVGDPYLPPPGEVTCDAAPRVARDASVLCRADVDGWYGIVRFTDGDGSFELLSVHGPDWSGP